MFTALEPIFNEIYKILNDEFAVGTDPVFKTFEKGFQYKQQKIISKEIYPWGFLDWGKPGNVSLVRAPRVFGYRVIFPLVLITYADEGEQETLIYQGNVSTNTNLGIGDLITQVSSFIWNNYHERLFPVPPSNEWSVMRWTIDRVSEPTISYVRPLLMSPLIRAAQIDFNLEVTEITNKQPEKRY